MTRATSRWSNEDEFWVVDDEYGNTWEVVTTSERFMLVERQDSQRYYGAVFDGHDQCLMAYADNGIEDGYDCNQRYEFSETGGWQQMDEPDDDEKGGAEVATLKIGDREFVLPEGDETARLVAADALQEAGREKEADWLRSRAGAAVVTLDDGRQVVSPFGPELVAKVGPDCVVRCFSVEAADGVRFDTWREVSSDMGAETGDGWYVLPRSDSDADVRALETALEASDQITAYEEMYLFAAVSSLIPIEFDREFVRGMDAEFGRLAGTYDPHWVMADRDGWVGVFERVVREWLADELPAPEEEGGDS